MVEQQLRRRGIRAPRVLQAMLTVAREAFVPAKLRGSAYDDRALPIGHGQTISQPYIVAFMTEQLLLDPPHTVLEIGTGTGYQTAIVARLAKRVHTVERIEALQKEAAANLQRLQLDNVTLHLGDGSLGFPESAPYDRILATAAAPKVPPALLEQLADGGVLVMPVGEHTEQTIVRVVRRGSSTTETPMLACRFVKLIGREGWAPTANVE